MTDDVTDRARAALEGITDGPWKQNGNNGVHTPTGRCIATTHSSGWNRQGFNKRDSEFIAAARMLVPELLAEVERLRGALERITDSTKREGVAWLLWCANNGYLLRSDRTILTSHFGQPAEHIHPDDQAEIPGWLELADDLLAVLRGDQ